VLATELARVVERVRQRVRRDGPTQLTGLDVREVQDRDRLGVLVTLGGEAHARPTLEALARELSADPGVVSVALSVRSKDSPTFFGAAPEVVAGASEARDQLSAGGPYHLVSHGAFVQAHRGQAEALALRMLDGLRAALGTLDSARVLELYAGSGALGLLLCRHGARPLLVEQFAPALALVRKAGEAQGLRGLDTRVGDAAEVATALVQARERFDAVIVNPPRRGLPARVRSAIAALAPRALIYLSCDPETLARDLDHLARLGYRASVLAPFDLMPLTDAVETLVVLIPSPPPEIHVLYEDDELIAVDKPPHLPTTPQGDQPHSLLETLRAQRGMRALTPVHRLDLGTSGVCLLAKHSSGVAKWASALKAGEKQYLALVRGVTRDKGSVRRPLRDGATQREARTRYTRLELLSGHSLLRARPDEGRLHQIRRHLAAIGHPVLGDARHGDAASNRHFEQKHGLDRTFLHLARIELLHPRSGAPLSLESPLPGDLATIRDRLRQPT
jgi:23S rRNA (uracil1939-C5)-methyltransferase